MQLVTDKPGQPALVWQWLSERNHIPWSSDLRTIGLMREDGTVAGAVGYANWTRKSCFMHVAFDSPHSLTRQLLRAAFKYLSLIHI